MNDLLEIYKGLELPEQVSAVEIFSTASLEGAPHRIGKDARGNPALLIPTLGETGSAIHLEHLDVRRSVNCRVKNSGKVEDGSFTIITCTDADEELAAYFIRSVDPVLRTLGPSPTAAEVTRAIEHLVELFRALAQAPSKSVSGLWAELFVISECSSPRNLMRAWHTDAGEKYDFNGGDQRIEVKSSTQRTRMHHFSIDQLNPPANTKVVAVSIFTERSGGGTSLQDLMDRISTALNGDSELESRLNHIAVSTLGNALQQGLGQRFDEELARQSLKVFEARVIPKLSPPLPAGISDVHFRSDLNQSSDMTGETLRTEGGLFAELATLIS